MTLTSGLCLVCMRDRAVCGHGAPAEAEPDVLEPGSILHGQYRIGYPLGRGGFGVTYIASDVNIGTRFAIKEFFPRAFVTRMEDRRSITVSSSFGEAFSKSLDRFLGEARTLAQFQHSSIVSILNYFEENGTAYFVMPYLEGRSLDVLLAEQPARRLPEQVTLRVFWGIFGGLDLVHQAGLIHRDIKPANVYLIHGDVTESMLLDFGAARQTFGHSTQRITVILTPGYAPPEQYSSNIGIQGPWSDIYACAATLYECLTGTKPPAANERIGRDPLEPPSQLAAMSPAVEKAILAGLSVEVRRRPQNIADFRTMLGAAGPITGVIPRTAVASAPTEISATPTAPMPARPGTRGTAHEAIVETQVKPREGYLVALGGEYKGRRIPIGMGLALGRDTSCNLIFDANQTRLSRRHARITYDAGAGSFTLTDLGSTFGAFVRARGVSDLRVDRHGEQKLTPGQEFYLADVHTAWFRVEEG